MSLIAELTVCVIRTSPCPPIQCTELEFVNDLELTFYTDNLATNNRERGSVLRKKINLVVPIKILFDLEVGLTPPMNHFSRRSPNLLG